MNLSVYPARVWGVSFFLLAIGLLPGFEWGTYAGVLFYGFFEVVSRNQRTNPLGIVPDAPYYNWLKTTPYHPSQSLPNGPLLPSLRDLVFLLALAVAMLPIVKESVWLYAMMVCLYWALMMMMYSIIAARQLVNMGPHWIGFAIIITLAVAIRIYFSIFTVPDYNYLLIISPVLLVQPAFILAIFGLKRVMERYPWTEERLKPEANYRGYSLHEIRWGYVDVMSAGLPYTSLRPRAHLPKISWTDATLMSLLPAVVMPLSFDGTVTAPVYGLIASGAVVARFMFYFNAHGPSPITGGLMISMRQGKLWNNAVFSLLILLLIDICGIAIVRYLPAGFSGIIGAILMFLTWLAAFKLPPSRATWETSGRWIISNEVPEPKKKNITF